MGRRLVLKPRQAPILREPKSPSPGSWLASTFREPALVPGRDLLAVFQSKPGRQAGFTHGGAVAIVENATFEADTDNHIVWFDCTVTRVTTDAHGGTACLEVVQAADFAGVQLNNHPYWAVTGGNTYDFSIWYKEATATMPTVTWSLSWRQNDGNTVEGTNAISLVRATVWTQATGQFTAPAAAARLTWTFETSAGNGAAWRLDDLLVQDAIIATPSFKPVIGPPAAVMRAVL